MTPLPGGFPLDYRLLGSAKALLAVCAFVLLVWDARFGARPPAGWIRIRTLALGAIGVLSFAAWWNFGALHGPGRPLHLHDFFHYYIGSKYYAELGYTRIYQCAAVAEVQAGRAPEVARRWTRNLETNALERLRPGKAERDECLSRFGDERWREFRADVEWFHGHMSREAWAGVPMVFGHNATPVWNAMGRLLTSGSPASDRQILALGALDPLLIAIMWLVIWRTFGWPVACVAAVWWGLNEASRYHWVGGGFLRQDVLFCLVGAVCAMRTDRKLLAGLAMGTAVMLRAFPVFLLAGLAVRFVYVARAGGLRGAWAAYRRFAAGLAIAGTTLLVATAVTWSGSWESPVAPWAGFAENSGKHLSTPITNHLGLKPVLSFSPETRAARVMNYWLDGPWDTWRAARAATFESRKPIYVALASGFAILFWISVRSLPDWMAIVAGVTLLPFATTLANYYYSVFVLLAFLWPLDKAIGAGLAALSAFTIFAAALFDQRDDQYALISAAVVLYALFVAVRLRAISRASAPPAESPTAAQPAAG